MGWLFGKKRTAPEKVSPKAPPPEPAAEPETFWQMFTRVWAEERGQPLQAPRPRPGEPGHAMLIEDERSARERIEAQEALLREMARGQKLPGVWWPGDR